MQTHGRFHWFDDMKKIMEIDLSTFVQQRQGGCKIQSFFWKISDANVFSSCSNKSQSSEDEHSNNNQWKTVSPSRFSPLTQHLHGPGSDSTLFDIIVNEIEEASSLVRSVKVNSPSQKRVSPRQSGPVGGARRIMLQSVSPFPSIVSLR